MQITPNSKVASCRQYSIVGLSANQITAKLGFEPNVSDDPHKVVNSWGATVDGKHIAIWDYKGSHRSLVFSAYGDYATLVAIFGSFVQK